MNEQPKLLYYSLVPVYDLPQPGLLTAAAVTCIATGKILAGSGGPGYAVHPKIVEGIDMLQNGGKARVIIDAEDYDAMTGLLRRSMQGEDISEEAAKLLGRFVEEKV